MASQSGGILIEHPPPYFYVEYGEYKTLVNIYTLGVISGNLPPRALGLVIEWAYLHQDELNTQWEKAKNLESLGKIAPLKLRYKSLTRRCS
jgi:hypothetical protein